MVDWNLVLNIAIPVVGGAVIGIKNSPKKQGSETTSWYDRIKKSPYNPPKFVFGPVWMTLYTGMGTAFFLCMQGSDDQTIFGQMGASDMVPIGQTRTMITAAYSTQLALNFLWSPLFFGMKRPDLALIEMVGLLGINVGLTVAYQKYNKVSSLLMVPYLMWLGYATYLTGYIVQNNPSFAPSSKGESKEKEE